jgi:hypothetical protein
MSCCTMAHSPGLVTTKELGFASSSLTVKQITPKIENETAALPALRHLLQYVVDHQELFGVDGLSHADLDYLLALHNHTSEIR